MQSDLSKWAKGLGADWTRYSLLASLLLYVAGYLALRFHITAIGIGTDLTILDERYLFTGARFFVYLATSIPIVIFAGLLLMVPLWILHRLMPQRVQASLGRWIQQPKRLAIFGIVFSVLMIQLVMRQCFVFTNLLLAEHLPSRPGWLANLLLNDSLMPIYFSLLIAACALPIAILFTLRKESAVGRSPAFAKGLLCYLATVQLLLLPINYGILIIDKVMPKVATVSVPTLAPENEAWLVWEGRDGVTFLVRHRDQKRRALVTLPRSDVKRIEILRFDPIVPTLFRDSQQSKLKSF